jgi:heme A synthase
MLGWKRMKEGFHLKSKLEIGLLMVMGAIAAVTFSGCGCRTFEQC